MQNILLGKKKPVEKLHFNNLSLYCSHNNSGKMTEHALHDIRFAVLIYLYVK